jgi:hypothetical protein
MTRFLMNCLHYTFILQRFQEKTVGGGGVAHNGAGAGAEEQRVGGTLEDD